MSVRGATEWTTLMQDATLALLSHTEEDCFTDEIDSIRKQKLTKLCDRIVCGLEGINASSSFHSVCDLSDSFIQTNIKGYNSRKSSDESHTFRETFRFLPSKQIEHLAPILTSLMADRVDRMSLLPTTQDEGATLEILTSSRTALTISRLSLSAARVYSQMIGMKGSWSAGLIDVGTISCLSALVRRWCVECRGREKFSNEQDNEKMPRQSKKRNRKNSSKVQKRPRKIKSVDCHTDSDDEEAQSLSFIEEVDSADDENDEERITTPVKNEAYELVESGLKLALSLSKPLALLEFHNWNFDAKEPLIDSVITCLATASALLPSINEEEYPARQILELIHKVVHELTESLQICVRSLKFTFAEGAENRKQFLVDVNENEHSSPVPNLQNKMIASFSQDKEATVAAILRALYPLLMCQVVLPNGMKGKLSAFQKAKSVLADIAYLMSQMAESLIVPRRLSQATPRLDQEKYLITRKTPLQKSPVNRMIAPSLKTDITPKSSRKFRPELNCANAVSRNVDSSGSLRIIIGIIQKIATSSELVKSEPRTRAIDCIMACLNVIPENEKLAFVDFVVRICRSKVSSHRIVGSQILGELLSSAWLCRTSYAEQSARVRASSTTPSSVFPSVCTPNNSRSSNVSACALKALIDRLSDRSPSVRASAVLSLSAVLNCTIKVGSATENIILSRQEIFCSLVQRVKTDDKATVRKTAIAALTDLIICVLAFSKHFVDISEVTAFTHAFSDTSVIVRKAAVDGITRMMFSSLGQHINQELSGTLECSWVQYVLPLVNDVETSCAQRVVESFESLIIDPIVKAVESGPDWLVRLEAEHLRAWNLLFFVVKYSFEPGATKSGIRALRCTVAKSFEKNGTASKSILKSLLRGLYTAVMYTLPRGDDSIKDNMSISCEILDVVRTGSWCLLETIFDCAASIGDSCNITGFDKALSIDELTLPFLCSAWDQLLSFHRERPSNMLLASTRSCLRILSIFANNPTYRDQLKEVGNSLKHLLGSFSLSPDLISEVISVLVMIFENQSRYFPSTVTSDSFSLWISELYSCCEAELDKFATSLTTGHSALSRVSYVTQIMYTVGELSMIGFLGNEESELSFEKESFSKHFSVRGLFVKPSAKLIALIQASLLPTLPQLLTEVESPKTPQAIRAHAFVALGKLCLRDEKLARESINVFAQELGSSGEKEYSTLQNNALLVLGDLCVKYTHLVTKFVPIMSSCLQCGIMTMNSLPTVSDKNTALVRRQAVLLITSLILQGYIKFKGVLFYRFLIAAVDDDVSVSNLATVTLCGPLRAKYPTLFFNNFVETVFVMNACQAHPMHESGISTDDPCDLFTDLEYTVGSECKKKREDIYSLLVANMSDEEKIGVTARLVKGILSPATQVDGDFALACQQPHIGLSTPHERNNKRSELNVKRVKAHDVLSDCLTILVSPQLCVSKTTRKRTDDDDEDQNISMTSNGVSTAQLNAVKGRLLSKISRKQLVEAVLPVLCQLKTVLEKSRSPLLKNLMQYMVFIFRSFKSEVQEVLSSDITLLQELEYDTKNFERDKNSLDLTEEDVV